MLNDGGIFKADYKGYEEPSSLYLDVAPFFGLFLNENLAVGASIGFSYSNTNDNKSDPTVEKNFESFFAPFARYRFATLGKFGFWAESEIILSRDTGKQDSASPCSHTVRT